MRRLQRPSRSSTSWNKSSNCASSSTMAITVPLSEGFCQSTSTSFPRTILQATFVQLNIVHRFGVAYAMTLSQFLNGCRSKDLLCHLINLLPDAPQGAAGREFAGFGLEQTLHGWLIPFQGLHDLSHGDLRRRPGQHMPSSGTTHAFDQTFFAQGHQNLVQVRLWHPLPVSDIRAFDRSLPIMHGQVQHCPQAIIAFHGEFHLQGLSTQSTTQFIQAGTLCNRPVATNPARLHEGAAKYRSEEHTSELQSRQYLVCRLLLEKKKRKETKSCLIVRPWGLL